MLTPFQKSFPHIESMDDDMLRVIQTKTGAQRLEIASKLYSSARQMLMCHLKTQFPHWSQSDIQKEAARRLSHGAT